MWTDASQALAVHDKDVSVWHHVGTICMRLGRFNAALGAFRSGFETCSSGLRLAGMPLPPLVWHCLKGMCEVPLDIACCRINTHVHRQPF